MTRELKIALLIGFCLVLVVSVLIADHLSAARNAKLAEASGEQMPLVRDPLGTDMPVIEPGAGIAPGPLAVMPATTDPMTGATLQPQDSTLVASNATNETHPETYAMVGPMAVREPEAGTNLGTSSVPSANTATNPDAPFTLVQGSGQPGIGNTNPNATNSGDPRTLVARTDGTQNTSGETIFDAAAREGVNLLNGNGELPTAMKVQTDLDVVAARKAAEEAALMTSTSASYTVKSGDNLYKIAKKLYGNGEKWRTLADANKDKISKNGNLKVGAVLKVPGMKPSPKPETTVALGNTKASDRSRNAESAVVAKVTTKPEVKPEAKKPTTYTVKPGDSLGKISQATLGTSKRVDDIIAANKGKLHDADDIKVGMVLAIPAR